MLLSLELKPNYFKSNVLRHHFYLPKIMRSSLVIIIFQKISNPLYSSLKNGEDRQKRSRSSLRLGYYTHHKISYMFRPVFFLFGKKKKVWLKLITWSVKEKKLGGERGLKCNWIFSGFFLRNKSLTHEIASTKNCCASFKTFFPSFLYPHEKERNLKTDLLVKYLLLFYYEFFLFESM